MMSKEIEAWCSIVKDCVPELFNTEDSARQHAERYGGIAVKLTGKMPSIDDDFDVVVVDGVTYYDSKKDHTHQEALDLAAKHGLRVMESWEMHKLWIESEAFRKSLEAKWYWCASVISSNRSVAWQFNGNTRYVSNNLRSFAYGVRCVARP